MIVEQPANESLIEKYIGGFVNLKLHDPQQFEANLSELEAASPDSNSIQNLKKSIDNLINTKYKVQLQNHPGLDNSSYNHVCSKSIVEYPELLESLQFWFNRVGLVSTYLRIRHFI